MAKYETIQNGMVVAWEKIAVYGHKFTDSVVTFLQDTTSIDPRRLVSQDGWRLSSFAVSMIVPLMVLFFAVNFVLFVICGRKKKSLLPPAPLVPQTEEPKEEILELKELLPEPTPKKPRIPRIDMLDKVYSHLESVRWMKQARLDVKSASSDLQEDRMALEWACFKCQQGAEKALKACIIALDLHMLDRKSHDLVELAKATEDKELVEIASRLSIVLGIVGTLRYPDYLPYPQIPHDMYTFDQAARVMELSRILLEVITEKSFSDIEFKDMEKVKDSVLAENQDTMETKPDAVCDQDDKLQRDEDSEQ